MDDIDDSPPPGLPWFLRTVPQPRKQTASRPRLTALLDESAARFPLVLVAAPSGFGKTVAVAEWARRLDAVRWLSAVASADSAVLLAAIASDSPRGPGDGPVTLVVDDAHLLDPALVSATIASDAALTSGALTLVLVGQPRLTEHFSRAIASGLGTVIGSTHLGFTLSEVRSLTGTAAPAALTGTAPVALAEEVLAATAGWPIAVQLQTFAAQPVAAGSPGSGAGPTRPELPLTEYVERVLLHAMEPRLSTFVLAATTCTRLDANLARAVTGSPDAAQLLEECRRAGYFLEAYVDDGGATVYRWHDAFTAECRRILALRTPELARSYNATAARALAPAYPAEAAAHAFRAGEPAFAAALLRRNWLGLLLSGNTRTLESLCLQLPDDLRDSVELVAIRACCRDLLGDAEGAGLLRRRARSREVPDERSFTVAFSELLLAPDPASKAIATDTAHQVLGSPEGDDDYPHGLFLLGWSELRLRRDPERAVALLESAKTEAIGRGLTSLTVHSTRNEIFARTNAGHFGQAMALSASGPAGLPAEGNDWDQFDGGLAGCTDAYIRFWRGDFAGSLRSSASVIEAGGAETSFVGLARVYFALATAALGDLRRVASAKEILSRVSNSDKHGVPWPAYKRMAYARLFAVGGDLGRARQAADPLLNHRGIPVTHALLAEFYRTIDQPALAHLALQKIRHPECPPYARALALATLAGLEGQSGRHDDAHRHLAQALDLTASEGIEYPFLGADPGFGEVLNEYARRSTGRERRLAALLGLRSAVGRSPTSTLTAREHDVLGHLQTSMSAQEIAEALHLSLATVRTHTQSIYRKLGVTSRREAVWVASR